MQCQYFMNFIKLFFKYFHIYLYIYIYLKYLKSDTKLKKFDAEVNIIDAKPIDNY